MTGERRSGRLHRLTVWRRHWRQAWRQAWVLLWERPVETVLTLLVMALAALPVLVLWLVIGQLQALEWQPGGDWILFLKQDVQQEQAAELARQLRQEARVMRVEVRAPQQVLQHYLQDTGMDADLRHLAPGVFPWVLEVTARPGLDAAQADALAGQWRARWPEAVEQVVHDRLWQQLRGHVAALLQRGLLWAALFSGLVLFFVVGNTAHLRVRRHQDAIEVMRVLGAGGAYLRRPYLLASALGGLLAGLIAAWIAVLFLWSMAPAWQGLLQLLGLPARLGVGHVWWLLLWPVLPALLSLVSARISLRGLSGG